MRFWIGGVFFCTAFTGAFTIGVDEVTVTAVAVAGMLTVLLVECFVAQDFIEGILGIRSMADRTGFVATAGVVDVFEWIVARIGVVGFIIARLGTIGLD